MAWGVPVDLIMVGNGQGLVSTILQHPADLDVAAPLCGVFEPEFRGGSSKRRALRELAASASGYCVEFHGREDGRVTGKAECGQVFALEVQPDSFADVESQLIKSGRLRDHRQIEALGNELAIASADTHLNRPSQRCDCLGSSMHQFSSTAPGSGVGRADRHTPRRIKRRGHCTWPAPLRHIRFAVTFVP